MQLSQLYSQVQNLSMHFILFILLHGTAVQTKFPSIRLYLFPSWYLQLKLTKRHSRQMGKGCS